MKLDMIAVCKGCNWQVEHGIVKRLGQPIDHVRINRSAYLHKVISALSCKGVFSLRMSDHLWTARLETKSANTRHASFHCHEAALVVTESSPVDAVYTLAAMLGKAQ